MNYPPREEIVRVISEAIYGGGMNDSIRMVIYRAYDFIYEHGLRNYDKLCYHMRKSIPGGMTAIVERIVDSVYFQMQRSQADG